MSGKRGNEEISLIEIAEIAGVHRQTAYWACRSGEIKGAHQVGGKLWFAKRRDVEKYAREVKKAREKRKAAAGPLLGEVAEIVHSAIRDGLTADDVRRRLTSQPGF